MPTLIEDFLNELTQTLKQADQFAEAGYEKDQVRDLVKNVGSSTEIFLKRAVLPHLSPKADFSACINSLKAVGVSREDRDALHSLRELYNESKHAPDYRPSIVGFQGLLPKVMDAIRSLGAMNLGLVNSSAKPQHSRVLWLAVWDHFNGGDSEVHIIVPSKSGWPPDLDLIYIDFMAWDRVKDLLAVTGSVRPGEGLIPPERLAQFAAEDDFREAIVFEGEYRTLIATLAAHERREDLLPGLRREDDLDSMFLAFTLASIDAATEEKELDGNWADAIAKRSVETYAVPANFRLLSQLANEFGQMIEQVPAGQRNLTNGPIWLTRDQFEVAKRNALALHPHWTY